jgi:CubicO group peptidase (beta-lactamase class C family)
VTTTPIPDFAQVHRGLLEYDAPVSQYWPEFAQEGKGHVTVADVLRHEGRVPCLAPRLTAAELADLDAVAARVAAQRPSSGGAPERAASGGARGRQYHALSRGFVCNELVRSSAVAAVAAYR